MLMGPELEPKGRSEVNMEALAGKENGGVSVDLEDKHLKFESNCGGNTMAVEESIVGPLVEHRSSDVIVNITDFVNPSGNGRVKVECEEAISTLGMNESVVGPLVEYQINDVDVNITESTNSGGNGLVKAECQEATESSSSFDDTNTGIENAANLSDSEVGSALAIDGFGDFFRMRKKKLTSHWRTFIRPLMWRCKWVELQIKKFDAQALKYNSELADYDQRKHFHPGNFNMEGLGVKSLPYSNDRRTDKILKRKKRRRIEETTDMKSYRSHHNLFSYYENNKRTTDGAYEDDDWAHQDKINGNDESEVNDERSWLESGDGDNSMEEIFRKIGVLQSQVSDLKTRLNKVISENAGKFSSADNLGLLVPSNGLTSSARPLASPLIIGDRMLVGSSNIASQLVSQYNVGNVVMPESAVSSHGEASYLPDVIESTDQPHLGDARINPEDDILIYNERLKEEMNNFDGARIQPMETPQVAKVCKEDTFPTLHVEADLPTDDQPPPKIRSISKLTATKGQKKRGRRKAVGRRS